MKINKYYQYAECGLDNVYISGLQIVDDAGDECITIPAIQDLHNLIAFSLLNETKKLTGNEFYFIRGELGLNIQKLAKLLNAKVADLQQWQQQSIVSNELDNRLKQYCKQKHYADVFSSIKLKSSYTAEKIIQITCADNKYSLKPAA